MKRSQSDDLRLDRTTAEDLLSGRVPAGAAAPYARLALVLGAAAAPSDRDSTPEAGVLARLGSTAREAKGRGGLFSRRYRAFHLSFRSKVAVVGMTLLLVLTGSLAAAGALPDGAQRVAHNMLKKVGVHVPGPNARAGNHPFERGKSGKPKKNVPGSVPTQNPHWQPSPSEGGS